MNTTQCEIWGTLGRKLYWNIDNPYPNSMSLDKNVAIIWAIFWYDKVPTRQYHWAIGGESIQKSSGPIQRGMAVFFPCMVFILDPQILAMDAIVLYWKHCCIY